MIRKMKIPKSRDISVRINAFLEVFGVNEKTLAKMLRVSESTVRRWKKGIGARRAQRSYVFRKLEEIMALSIEVFEKDGPIRWFNREALALGNVTPIEFIIKNDNGLEEVRNLLGRIEWGVVS